MSRFALVIALLSAGFEPPEGDKPLTPYEAGRQLGRIEQALETGTALAATTKSPALEKELKEWKAEYTKIELRVRKKAEKNEPLGEELETSLRLLQKGIGQWSGKVLEARMAERQTGKPPLNPLLPFGPVQGPVVTMDFSDYTALLMMQQFAGHPEVQKLMEKMSGQAAEAMKGLDLTQPGAGREFIQRLGKMAAENARKGGQKKPPEPEKKR